MQIIDTHSHIYHPDFEDDIELVVERALDAGVQKILLPNVDIESIDKMHSLVDRYPHICHPMMGLHPTDVKENWEGILSLMKKHLTDKKYNYLAIGEVGIDLYWDKTYIEEQKSAFITQLEWSIEYDLPVVIHSRDSNIETIECIHKVGAEKVRGVFHSFTGTEEELARILDLKNFYIGINGVVTFKKATLPEVLKNCKLSKIVIETDAPYLAPTPYRGKRNEPAYTLEVVKKLSDIYKIEPELIGQITTENAEKLFRL